MAARCSGRDPPPSRNDPALPTALVSIPFGAVIALQLGNLTRQLGAQSFTGSASVLAVIREALPGTVFGLEQATGFAKEPTFLPRAEDAARRELRIGPLDEVVTDKGATVVDVSGCRVMPGLIDTPMGVDAVASAAGIPREQLAEERAARVRFRRALTLMAFTLLVPGSAQLLAGNRQVGVAVMQVVDDANVG